MISDICRFFWPIKCPQSRAVLAPVVKKGTANAEGGCADGAIEIGETGKLNMFRCRMRYRCIPVTVNMNSAFFPDTGPIQYVEY